MVHQKENQQLSTFIKQLYIEEKEKQLVLDSILNNNGIPYPPQLDGICFYISPSYDDSERSSCIENDLFLRQVLGLLIAREKDEIKSFHPSILLLHEEYIDYK